MSGTRTVLPERNFVSPIGESLAQGVVVHRLNYVNQSPGDDSATKSPPKIGCRESGIVNHAYVLLNSERLPPSQSR